MNDWKPMELAFTMPAVRTGWRGVWDALVSAATGCPRPAQPAPYRIAFWMKVPRGAVVQIRAARLEKAEA